MLIIGETGCGVYGNSVLSSQFFYKPKIVYSKTKSLLFKKKSTVLGLNNTWVLIPFMLLFALELTV